MSVCLHPAYSFQIFAYTCTSFCEYSLFISLFISFPREQGESVRVMFWWRVNLVLVLTAAKWGSTSLQNQPGNNNAGMRRKCVFILFLSYLIHISASYYICFLTYPLLITSPSYHIGRVGGIPAVLRWRHRRCGHSPVCEFGGLPNLF